MNKDAQKIIGWLTVLFVGIASLFIWVTWEQETVGGADAPSPTDPVTVTPTDAPVKIVFEEGVPTAVAFTHTPSPSPTPLPTPTKAPTATPTPTEMPPTPTEKPVERIAAPKATNTPTATATPVIRNSVAYPTGYPHTAAVDRGHEWKPWARYTKITNKASAQYRLQQTATTADNGLRVVTDPNGIARYCIALAPQWAGGKAQDIGRCIDVYMVNGSVLHCVLADIKKPEHTKGGEGYYGSQGEVTEWIADQNKLPDIVRKSGNVSRIGEAWQGDVSKIVVLDYYIKGFGE